MQVVFHLGAHCTDEDRLVKSLGKNRAALAASGIIVPVPWRYRPVFREMQAVLRGQPARPEMQETLLDAVMDEDRAERLVFSNELFLCVPQRVVSDDGFYSIAHRKFRALANIFPGSDCEFHLCLRNPATLIPALIERGQNLTYEGLMNGRNPLSLRWSEVIARCLAENPGVRLVVWCNEDTPLIWPDVLRRVAGVGAEVELDGELDMVATILRPEGTLKLKSALAAAGATRSERRRILEELLAEFVKPDALEMDIALPGWTEEIVEAMTENYEADLADIAGMAGVEFLTP